MSDEVQPVRESSSGSTGLSTQDVWALVEIVVRGRGSFATADGLAGRSILDYPGGFRFAPPRGVSKESFRRHHTDPPSYVLWAYAADASGTYTVAWYSDERGWFIPELDEAAPIEVRHHQWFVRALTAYPLPEMRQGVDI